MCSVQTMNEQSVTQRGHAHQQCGETTDMPQEQSDIKEHDEIADSNGHHIGPALTVNLICDGSLKAYVDRERVKSNPTLTVVFLTSDENEKLKFTLL